MAPSSSKSSKPKASDVAAETKKTYIPHIKHKCSDVWPTQSILFHVPLVQLSIPRIQFNPAPPYFSGLLHVLSLLVYHAETNPQLSTEEIQ
jgi:hypothetical protein